MLHGVDFLPHIALFLLTVCAAPFQVLAKRLFWKCPAALILIVGGTLLYPVYSHTPPLIAALAGAVFVILLSLPDIFPRLRSVTDSLRLQSVFESVKLKVAASFALILLYAAILANSLGWNIGQEETGPDIRQGAWPLLALPVHYTGSDPPREDDLNYRWQLFSAIQSELGSTLRSLDETLEVIPKVGNRDEFKQHSERFSAPEKNLGLLRLQLKNFGAGKCEKARLVLRTGYLKEAGGDGGRVVDITPRLFRCVPPSKTGELPKLLPVRGGLFRTVVYETEYDLVSLIIIVQVLRPLMYMPELSKSNLGRIWKGLNEGFRNFYALHDKGKNRRGENWPGHKLYEEKCSGKKCVHRWKRAYDITHQYRIDQLETSATPQTSVKELVEQTAKIRTKAR